MASWDFSWEEDGDSSELSESDTGSSESNYSGQFLPTNGLYDYSDQSMDAMSSSGHSTDGMSVSGQSADGVEPQNQMLEFAAEPSAGYPYHVHPEPALPVDAYQTTVEDEQWDPYGTDSRPPPYRPQGLYDDVQDMATPPVFAVGSVPDGVMWEADVSVDATRVPQAPLGAPVKPEPQIGASVKLEASAPPPSIVPLQWGPRPGAAAIPAQPQARQIVPKARPFDSSTVVPPPLVCPFCNASPEASASEEARNSDDDAETKRRSRRERKQPRANFKLGQWWKGFGYVGPRYCQRCSEVFRDHLIRQQSNSANCTRTEPCNDCAKVLDHFEDLEPWAKIDAREEQNRLKRKQKLSKTGAPTGLKKSRMAAATATVVAALVVFLGFRPEYLQSDTVLAGCAQALPNIKNSIAVRCRPGPVGQECKYQCTAGYQKKILANNATAPHVCQANTPGRQPEYTGGVCEKCTGGLWSAGGDMRCTPCTKQCPLGFRSACSATADAACVIVSGPHRTLKGELPPRVIDAATFVSPSGERYLFGGQGPSFMAENPHEFGDAEGYSNTLVQYLPPVGIGGVTWKTYGPASGEDSEAWPLARAGAMVWQRDEHRWFMFGGNRGGTTGMSDIWSFDTSGGTPDTPYWTNHCPDPGAPIVPPPGTVGYTTMHYSDFPSVCSTTNIAPHLPQLPETKIIDGMLDIASWSDQQLLAQWPLARGFGTITAVPCPPNSSSGCTTNQAWLFGGVAGYDHRSEWRAEHKVPNVTWTNGTVMEAAALNDLWHLEWDREGSINWTFVGPYGLDFFVSNRGSGNTKDHFFDGDAGPEFGLWISSRSGHAAWAAADGRLFIFGGVGLELRLSGDDKVSNMQRPCYAVSPHACPCAMLSDLWTLYPHRGAPPEDDGPGLSPDPDSRNHFMPNTGWELSKWGWHQLGRNTNGGDFPDVPGLELETLFTPSLAANMICMNHWKRPMPLEDQPDRTPAKRPPFYYNHSVPHDPYQKPLSGPVARRAAVAWTDPDTQTGWMYGGENFFNFGNELMSDLWKFNLAVPTYEEDAKAGRPVKVMEQVRTPPGKGAPDGLPMRGRARAAAWIAPTQYTGRSAVVYGGAGGRRLKSELVPLWQQPWSTDPWTTEYLDDVWVL